MIYRTLWSGLALTTLAACASQPPPTRHLGSALAATSAAQEAGASRVPPAALHLSLAREQLDQAERMIDDGMNERANDLTIRAYNDAKLALALAHEAELKARLDEVKRETEDSLSPREAAEPSSAMQPPPQASTNAEPASAEDAPVANGRSAKPAADGSGEPRVPEQQRAKAPAISQPEEH